ncbi:MAG: hypothetical protein CMH83_05285 [Nocardioides sp.]|nr:hypothetical protein [Nocardioides sp.]
MASRMPQPSGSRLPAPSRTLPAPSIRFPAPSFTSPAASLPQSIGSLAQSSASPPRSQRASGPGQPIFTLPRAGSRPLVAAGVSSAVVAAELVAGSAAAAAGGCRVVAAPRSVVRTRIARAALIRWPSRSARGAVAMAVVVTGGLR